MRDSDKTVEMKPTLNEILVKLTDTIGYQSRPEHFNAFNEAEQAINKMFTEVAEASRREALEEVLKLKQLSDMKMNYRYVHYFIDASKVEELQKES